MMSLFDAGLFNDGPFDDGPFMMSRSMTMLRSMA
jgi:hypothetical protein